VIPDKGTFFLVTRNLQAVARCAERVVCLERSVKAWAWGRSSGGDRDLAAIQIASGDHRAMAVDGDSRHLRQSRTSRFRGHHARSMT
jgi:hypothetical protein